MLRDHVVGTWELTSYTLRNGLNASVVHPFGEDAMGLLIYSPDGYMSVQLMRANRPLFDRADSDGGTTEQAASAASGYLAYSGPFDVDEPTGALRHEATISLLPNWVDGTLVRHSSLQENQLTLSGTSTDADGSTIVAKLVWTRALHHGPPQ
jgi:Lipocalin-like domain